MFRGFKSQDSSFIQNNAIFYQGNELKICSKSNDPLTMDEFDSILTQSKMFSYFKELLVYL